MQILLDVIPKYAELDSHMKYLLKKTKSWSCGSSESKSFEALKNAMVASAELAFPNFKQTFTVHSDAMASDIGG